MFLCYYRWNKIHNCVLLYCFSLNRKYLGNNNSDVGSNSNPTLSLHVHIPRMCLNFCLNCAPPSNLSQASHMQA